MKFKLISIFVGCGLWVTGCSSIPVPSLHSLSWSSSSQKPDPTAEALFEEGMRYFKDKRYARAIDDFSKIKSDYPFSPLLTQTELQIADAYYLNEQYPEAINAFKEFESMHPTNENMPFVIYRLGQAYFDQFTAIDRDQKTTETAKGYFEAVLAKYPQSPYAAQAKEKLAKCNGYLAEHDFSIAQFYFQHEKYPAARDRFEEIVRRYRGTPAAAKSLFFLGESYRQEKNSVKAALAYEALIQHYPDNPYTPQAKTQLAQIDKEKQDPLAMLLMRDGHPRTVVAENSEGKTTEKRRVDNLVAKTEMVYEEPGAEKSVLSRVVDKINPFSSSDSDKKSETYAKDNKSDSETTIEKLAKKKQAEDKQNSPGVFASIWHGLNPFAGKEPPPAKTPDANGKNNVQLVQRIDDSLKSQGIDSQVQTAALTPPAVELPKPPVAPPPSDTKALIGTIDSDLKKQGKEIEAKPQPPEAGQIFNRPDVQALAAKGKPDAEPAQSATASGLLGAIDQKLESKGVEPPKVDLPKPPAAQGQESAPKPPQQQKVELEPNVTLEKGPLYLPASQVPKVEDDSNQQQSTDQNDKSTAEKTDDSGAREIPKALITGPSQPAVSASAKPAKPSQPKTAATYDDDEQKSVIDQLKEDAEGLSKLLNPFRW